MQLDKSSTQDPKELADSLALGSWNDIDDVPKYSNDPRCKVRSVSSGQQEISLDVYRFEEIDTPAFEAFLEQSVNAFAGRQEQLETDPTSMMPWKVLGQRWHFMRNKGFKAGKKVQWPEELLKEAYGMLCELAGDGNWEWTNKMLVHLTLEDHQRPWVTLNTKRSQALGLHVTGPKGSLSMGRIANLGFEPDLDATDPEVDVAQLNLTALDQLDDLRTFLDEHLSTLISKR